MCRFRGLGRFPGSVNHSNSCVIGTSLLYSTLGLIMQSLVCVALLDVFVVSSLMKIVLHVLLRANDVLILVSEL